jgi:hypothetical protein
MAGLFNAMGNIMFPNAKIVLDRVGNEIKVPKSNATIERLPYDQSAFGFLDKALRSLPPIIRNEAEKLVEISAWKAGKLIGKYIKTSVNEALGIYTNVLYDPNTGLITSVGQSLLNEIKNELSTDNKIDDRSGIVTGVNFTENSRGGFTANKVNSSELVDSSNWMANNDLNNSLAFIPKDESIWYIELDRYIDESIGGTALPEIPSFSSKYNSDFSVDYSKWLPALNYQYNRRNISETSDVRYGWGNTFKQLDSAKRGTSFKINLIDDINRSFSKFTKTVVDLSTSYVDASITYWRLLVFKITLYVMNRQWELIEKYTLLGLLNSDGTSNLDSNDSSNIIRWEFDIVGEITGDDNKKLENESELSNVAPDSSIFENMKKDI